MREKLAADGRPVLLAFSCGKDSIAAWLAMRDMGIEVVPAYLYYVPGLRFVDEELDYFEQKFQTRIKRYPHPSLYRWLNNAVFQLPNVCATSRRRVCLSRRMSRCGISSARRGLG